MFKGDRFRIRKILALALALTVIVGVADLLLQRWLNHRHQQEQALSVSLRMAPVRARLEENLIANLLLVNGMAAYISVNPDLSDGEFAGMARALMATPNALKNITAAPDFVMRYVYPPAGNEGIIGQDYRRLPAQWEQARQARDRGQMVVAGPLKLLQGGTGLVGRVPVFYEQEGERLFWGLVSSVIDFELLLAASGFGDPAGGLLFALRGGYGQANADEVFHGPAELFLPETGAIQLDVTVPGGSWRLAATPAAGWARQYPEAIFYHFVVVLVFGLLATVAYLRVTGSTKQRESRRMLQSMSEASHDAMIVIDSGERIVFWNRAAESMFGYPAAEAIGRKAHEIMAARPQDIEQARAGMAHFAATGQGPVLNRVMEFIGKRRDGSEFPLQRSVAAFRMGSKWYAVGSLHDITARKAAQAQLELLANTDGLTGLFNRRHFSELAGRQIVQADRYGQPFSLVMLDVDHFKAVNDRYGHDVGDLVLREMARLIGAGLRQVDFAGRLGGEEFALALPETGLAGALEVAERLRRRVAEAVIPYSEGTLQVSISLGVTVIAGRDDTLDAMLKRADQALYQAKGAGRNRVEAASPA